MRSLALPLLLSAAQALMVPSAPGHYSVAVKHFEVVDSGRKDILAPLPGTARRFMSSVYLPVNAEYECKSQAVPYMPKLTAQVFGEMGEQLGIPQGTLEKFEMDFCDLSTLTLNVDADSEKKDSYPIAILSPGYGGTRFVYGAMARSLASLGYIVFTLDPTWEAAVVEFPDGSNDYSTNLGLENEKTTLEQLEMRVGDVSFLTSQLFNTTFTGPLLAQFPGTFDPKKVVVYGHSFGGATAAAAAQRIPAVIGGLNFDGTIYGPVNEQGFKGKPFVLVTSTGNYTDGDLVPPVPDWSPFYTKVDAPKMEVAVWGTQHYAFMDAPLLLTAFQAPPASQPTIEQTFGKIDGRMLEEAENFLVNGLIKLAYEGDIGPLSKADRSPNVYVIIDGLQVRQ